MFRAKFAKLLITDCQIKISQVFFRGIGILDF